MQVVKNFLPDHVLKKVIETYENLIDRDPPIGYTNLRWSPSIVKNSGIVYITPAEELEELIFQHLCELDNKFNAFRCETQYYTWGKGSYIPIHRDKFAYGATLYLNTNWELEDGGLFIYMDNQTGDLKAVSPEINTLVINDMREPHHVTCVNSFAKTNRVTLQIWGH